MKSLTLKKIYLNELKVDEPEGGPYGKVLFAPNREDEVEDEPNTSEETELLHSIIKHYKGSSKALKGPHRTILNLIKKGKYDELLKPPTENAYRYLQNISIQKATKVLGLSAEELRENTGKVMVSNNKAILMPSYSPIQSWTTEPRKAAQSFETLFKDEAMGNGVAMLIQTNTETGGKFFMNPEFASKIDKLIDFEDEYEVVSVGPIKIFGAAYCVCENKHSGIWYFEDIYPNLLKALGV